MASIAAVLAISDTASKAEAFKNLLNTAAASSDLHTFKAAVDAVLDDTLPIFVTKSVLEHVATACDSIKDNDIAEAIAEHAISQIRSRASSFEKADYALRYVLFRIYVGFQDYLRAATTLAQAKLDSASLTDKERAWAYVKVAQNYIRSEDDINAERFIRRASDYVFKLNDFELTLQFKTCYAQISDQKRKFLDAALRYIDLMRLVAGQAVDESDLKVVMEMATKCAIVAPAGPQRQRVMGTLIRDERIEIISPVILSMLEKMYTEKFIYPADAAAFDETLSTHHRATGSDGTTYVQKAIIEHNIQAASKAYLNISFTSLGEILGIPATKTERIASKMIAESRLAASIDQVDGVLEFFSDAKASAPTGGAGAPVGVDALVAWDRSIKEVCLRVNETLDTIVKAHPQLAPA